MKYLPLIWSGMWRKRVRAILIFSQVVIAFMLFGVLQGVESSLDAASRKLSADLYMVTGVGDAPLPLATYLQIKTVPGIKWTTYESLLRGTYQNPKQGIFAVAAIVDDVLKAHPTINISSDALEKMKHVSTGALVSNALANKYDWKIGQRIPLQSNESRTDGGQEWAFDIVGTFDQGDSGPSEFLIINYQYFNEARGSNKDSVTYFFLSVTEPKVGAAVAQAVDRLFLNSGNATHTSPLQESAQTSFQQVGDLGFLVRAIVGAVMFALLFTTAATLAQSLRERSVEFGILKAIGYSNRKISSLILAEVISLSTFAAAIGLVVARSVAPLARIDYSYPDVRVSTSVFIDGLLIALFLGSISAALPVWRISRLQINDALADR